MRFIIDTEDDKKRILKEIAETPPNKIILQAELDDDWKPKFFLIIFIEEQPELPKPQPEPKKKKK